MGLVQAQVEHESFIFVVELRLNIQHSKNLACLQPYLLRNTLKEGIDSRKRALHGLGGRYSQSLEGKTSLTKLL